MTERGVGARIGQVLAIVLVFVLIGPPVGTMVFMMLITLIGLHYQVDLQGLSWIALFSLIYALPIGYMIGIAPAAASGLAIGIRQAFYGRVAWWLALAVGIIVGVGFQVLTGQPLVPAEGASGMREQGAVMVLTCLCATMVCWALVRGWHVVPAGARKLA
jgi:hypothetical protein